MKHTGTTRIEEQKALEDRLYKRQKKLVLELLTIRAALDLIPILGLEEEEE